MNHPNSPLVICQMQRIFSLSLALLLLVGSVSVTVNRHFCMGELQSVTLFAVAEACHQEAAPSCPLHAKTTKKDCCSNDHELVKSDDDRQLVDVPGLPAIAWALVPRSLSPSVPFPVAPHLRSRQNKRFQDYRPPPIIVDAPRQYQVFRL